MLAIESVSRCNKHLSSLFRHTPRFPMLIQYMLICPLKEIIPFGISSYKGPIPTPSWAYNLTIIFIRVSSVLLTYIEIRWFQRAGFVPPSQFL